MAIVEYKISIENAAKILAEWSEYFGCISGTIVPIHSSGIVELTGPEYLAPVKVTNDNKGRGKFYWYDLADIKTGDSASFVSGEANIKLTECGGYFSAERNVNDSEVTYFAREKPWFKEFERRIKKSKIEWFYDADGMIAAVAGTSDVLGIYPLKEGGYRIFERFVVKKVDGYNLCRRDSKETGDVEPWIRYAEGCGPYPWK